VIGIKTLEAIANREYRFSWAEDAEDLIEHGFWIGFGRGKKPAGSERYVLCTIQIPLSAIEAHDPKWPEEGVSRMGCTMGEAFRNACASIAKRKLIASAAGTDGGPA